MKLKKKKPNTHTLTKDNKKRTVQPGVALKMLPLPISKREESAKAHGAERDRERVAADSAQK